MLILAFFGEFGIVQKSRKCDDAKTVSNRFVVDKSARGTSTDIGNIVVKNAITPGELPGYTGWARPEKTLARSFSIKSVSTSATVGRNTSSIPGIKGYEYVITVKCEGHEDCVVNNENNSKSHNINDSCASLFFLRAYGPAVIPGTVTSRSCGSNSIDVDYSAGGGSVCYYEISFVFYDPGPYTIEVVLTISSPPPILAFPLELNEQEPHYEGYLLPGFPLMASVLLKEEGETNSQILHQKTKKSTSIGDMAKEKKLCTFHDLVETSPTSAMEKARWKVTGRVNEKAYSSKTMNSSIVSTIGYINNVNSLGINMDYLYLNDCLIIPESSFDQNLRKKRAFSIDQCSGPKIKIHVVYIGDSIFRAQKDMLQDLLDGIPTYQVEFTFLSLHGGYRKNQVHVEKFLQEMRMKTKVADASNNENEKVVILFNTGLHDIHRLCGAEFLDERPTYLDKDRLSSGSFACVDEYKALLKDFLDVIDQTPAALKVYQSTTSGWPKVKKSSRRRKRVRLFVHSLFVSLIFC